MNTVATPPTHSAKPLPTALDWMKRMRRCAMTWVSVLANAVARRRVTQGFGILLYHRVTQQPVGFPPLTWNVTPEHFESQLAGLLARGFEAWPLKRVLEYQQVGRDIPANVFVITFDDGYANFYHHVLPVLMRLQVPATLFLATAYLDGTDAFPFDDWEGAGSNDVPDDTWLPLTTAQCRELLASGWVELAAHTHTHQDFRRREAEFAADMQQCVVCLHEKFGITAPSFAFPYGSPQLGFAAAGLVAGARQAGVRCALTTNSNLVVPGESPFEWGRFGVEDRDTPAVLAARLNGWANTVRDWGLAVQGLGRNLLRGWSK